MPKINIVQEHSKSFEDVRHLIDEVKDDIHKEYGISGKWKNGNTLDLTGPGVSGKLTVEPNQVTVSIKLGIVLRPFASVIEQNLRQAIKEKLGE